MCLFCKIANHEIPSSIVYEDEHVLAFLDINPVTKGHTLIIPKKHYANLGEVPSRIIARQYAIANKLAKHYDKILAPAGYNYLANTNSAAGQSVFHAHVHLIPRYDATDGLILRFEGRDQAKADDQLKTRLVLPIHKKSV